MVLAALLGLVRCSSFEDFQYLTFVCQLNHFYFNRFEPKSSNGAILVLTAQPLLLLMASAEPLSFSRILVTYIVFVSTLCASVITYRLSPWHPLAHIPGPTMNKITKLWGVCIASGGHQHRTNKALHDKYGPFVRTGKFEVPFGAFAFTYKLCVQGRTKYPSSTSTRSKPSWARVVFRRANVRMSRVK